MEDFVINNKGVLTGYNGNDTVLEIPNGVKIIGSDILGYEKGERVTKVVIPQGVTEIKERAFNSSNISEVIFPNTLTKIGDDAFGNCKNLKTITIPDGVTAIPNSAFWMSGLEEITIPDSVKEIGDGAFQYCEKLKRINFPNLENVKIGPQAFTGCKSLVDDNGLFILQNRVFTYHSDTKNAYVVIPDGVKEIELGAFEHSGQIHLEMSIDSPSWVQTGLAKKYGFARSLLDYTGSSISFRDADGNKVAYIVLSNKDETDPKENGAVLSIKSENGKFDFAGYDAYFASLAKTPNKIQVALARLKYPYDLSNEMLDVYQSFLKKQAVNAGMMLVDANDLETIVVLGQKQIFNATSCQKLIEYATSKNKLDIVAWLMEYNNNHFGVTPSKKLKTETFSLDGPIKLKKEVQGKSIAEWRKIFKFKYRDGEVIITDYLGEEECVTIPEKIGDKFVTGIGRRAFNFDLNKKVKKIIIPGWISLIEGGAFYLIEDVEIDIEEGVTNLPEDAFFVVSNLTIKLPRSIEQIGEQFGDSEVETIKMIVPSGSIAEDFCKKYELNYVTYEPAISNEMNKTKDVQQNILSQKTKQNEIANKSTWKKPKPGTHLISKYQGNETSVLFPTEVEGIKITGIANTSGDTPRNYKDIKEVTLPEGYTYIGNKAFAGCENLERILLPSTIEEIGTGAFADCKNLKELVIKKDISFVGNNIFNGSNINVLILETEKKTKIPSHLFFGCHINSLVVYGGPFKSNGNVFDYTGVSGGAAYAEELYDGNFPEAVYINDDFSTLDLKGIGGGNSKKIHPLSSFDESIIIDESIRSIIASEKTKKAKVVDNASKLVETVEVESIDFANSIFTITGFEYNESESITCEIEQRGGVVKDNVSSSINYLVVPDKEMIKNSAVKKTVEFQLKGRQISIIKLSECRRHMFMHDEKLFGVEGAEIAADYRLSIEGENVTLTNYVGNKTDVVVPEKIGDYSVVALGERCFYEGYFRGSKTNIESVTIPSSITNIPKEAFGYCSNLRTVNLPEGLLSISKYAFEECDELVNISLPDSLKTIEECAFIRCKKLKKLYIPANLHKLNMPFIGCEGLEEIIVAKENSVYDSRDNCNAIIETATNKIVVGCKNTTIPSTVTVIGSNSFAGNDSITEFTITGSIVEIEGWVFSGCMNLKNIEIADSVKIIGDEAFGYCDFEKVELPSKMTSLSKSAFEHCFNLKELVVKKS